DLQPATVVVADVEAIRLRQFVQGRFEENDCAVGLAHLIRVGETGIRRKHANEGVQLRYFSLEMAKGVYAGGIHGGGGRRSCPRVKGRNLKKSQTCRKSRNEHHHGGRYCDSERQHPISSARPLHLRSKKKIEVRKRQRGT